MILLQFWIYNFSTYMNLNRIELPSQWVAVTSIFDVDPPPNIKLYACVWFTLPYYFD